MSATRAIPEIKSIRKRFFTEKPRSFRVVFCLFSKSKYNFQRLTFYKHKDPLLARWICNSYVFLVSCIDDCRSISLVGEGHRKGEACRVYPYPCPLPARETSSVPDYAEGYYRLASKAPVSIFCFVVFLLSTTTSDTKPSTSPKTSPLYPATARS